MSSKIDYLQNCFKGERALQEVIIFILKYLKKISKANEFPSKYEQICPKCSRCLRPTRLRTLWKVTGTKKRSGKNERGYC